jgi:hypothetical protein
MSKIKDDNTILPEPEKIKKVEVNTENTLVPENYSAEQYLSWFMSDVQNIQLWAGTLFRGGFDNTDPKIIKLKQAALDSIKEVEDDILNLKNYLQSY